MMILFLIVSALLIASALGVVLFRNPIHCALSLVVALLGVAAVFAMLDAHFIATVQIVVYAGAIMVLVVFVLMLLNAKMELPRRGVPLSGGAAVLFAALFMLMLVPLFFIGDLPIEKAPAVPLEGSVEAMGKLLYSKYVFTFEAASILIMAAIVGAVMVAKRRYREVR